MLENLGREGGDRLGHRPQAFRVVLQTCLLRLFRHRLLLPLGLRPSYMAHGCPGPRAVEAGYHVTQRSIFV